MQTTAGRLMLIVTALALLAAGPTRAQQSDPLQITVQDIQSSAFPEVAVYATVTDGRGAPVEGLTASAFTLIEDGKPVEGVAVAPSERVDRPVSLVLALDVSESLGEAGVEAVRDAALALLDSLPTEAHDRIALVTFGSANEESIQVVLDFTDDLDTLRAAIKEHVTIGPSSAHTAIWGAAYKALEVLSTDREAAARRRRAVIILTDGRDNSLSGAAYLPEDTQKTQEEVIGFARQIGVPIYPVSFGTQTDTQALDALAEATEGTSYVETTPRDLADAFIDVLAKLRAEYRIDFTSGLTADGAPHDLTLRASYQAYTAEATTTFTAVEHPVEVNLNIEQGETITGSVLIQPEVDAAAPIAYGHLRLDGALLQEFGPGDIRYTWNPTQLAPGEYTLELQVRDRAGNEGTASVTVEVARPLTVEITVPTSNANLAGSVDVAFTVRAAEADLNMVALLADGREVESLVAPASGDLAFSWDAGSAELGGHQLEVVARDTLGNEARDSVVVTVVEPLAAALESPPPGADVAGEVPVAYAVEANVAPPASVALLVDGAEYARHTAPLPEDRAFVWDSNTAPLGAHTLEMVAADAEGNEARASVEVNVARALGVRITAPAARADVAGEVPVRFDFTGQDGDVASAAFWVEGRRIEAITDLDAGVLAWDAREVEPGLRQLEIRLTDTAGTAYADDVVVNVVAPLSVQLVEPPANTTLDGSTEIMVGYRAEANAGPLQSVQLLVDGEPATLLDDAPEPAGALPWDAPAAPLGTHTLEVVAADAEGNEARDAVEITLDRVLSAAIEAPAPGAEVTGTVEVRFTLEGQPADVQSAAFLVDDRRMEALNGLSAGENTLVWDADAAAPGAHTLEIRLTHALGREVSDTVTVNVVEPLHARHTSLLPGAVVNGEVEVGYAVDALAAPLYDVSLRVDDIEVDAAPAGEDGAIAAEGVLAWDASTFALGSHEVAIIATDTEERQTRAAVTVEVARPLLVDIRAPAMNARVPAVAGVEVRFALDGTPGDVARAIFLVDDRRVSSITGLETGANALIWDASAAGLGPHQLEVRLTDTLGGEVGDVTPVTVVPPLRLELLSPMAESEVAGQVAVRYRAEANAAELVRVALRVDGEDIAALEPEDGETAPLEGALVWDAAAARPGAHQVALTAEDAEGRTQTAAVPVTVVPPVALEVLAPVPDEVVAGEVAVRYRVEANAADLAAIALLVDGRVEAERTAPLEPAGTLAWDTAALAPGVHEIEVRAVDAAGHEAAQPLRVTVQRPLVVRVLAPEAGARVADRVEVKVSAEANAAALDRVALLVDGEEVAALESPQAVDTLVWETSDLPLGEYQVTVRAEDTAGNVDETAFSVTVAEPLTLDLTAPMPDERVTGRVSVRYRAAVTGASLQSVALLVDGETVETLTSPASEGVISWDTDAVGLGTHTLEVVATSSTGRTASAEAEVVVTRPLAVHILTPSEGQQVSGTVAVGYEISAAFDEITRAALLVNGEEAQALRGPLSDAVFMWETGDLGAGVFELAVQVRDVTGAEAASEPMTVQVIFQGNSLPYFIAVLVVLFVFAILIPLTRRRRRAVIAAGAAVAGEAHTEAYLVAESGPTSGTRWLLEKDETVVGRSRTRADVVVTGRTASRQHARISRRDDAFIYVDLKGENPSTVNGQPIEGTYTLQEGDVIEVGDTRLRFTREA